MTAYDIVLLRDDTLQNRLSQLLAGPQASCSRTVVMTAYDIMLRRYDTSVPRSPAGQRTSLVPLTGVYIKASIITNECISTYPLYKKTFNETM